jgi:Mg2+ and Co2+ transporter CorA
VIDETKMHDDFSIFDDFTTFTKAVEKETGKVIDLNAIVQLHSNFMESTDKFLIINVKEYGSDEPDNLLFLAETRSLLFSKSPPLWQEADVFIDVLQKPFGRSTVLYLITMSKILENDSIQLDLLLSRMTKLEQHFEHTEYRSLSLEFERLIDNLEELHEILLKLQERRFKQVETQYISFDYRVLIAESQGLQAKCRRRSGVLNNLRQDHEMKTTEGLNEKIVKLNDVVRKLTAITVILMLPTLIASHFGMNFAFMPELRVTWAYPAVIGIQIALMVVGVFIFRKIGWL